LFDAKADYPPVGIPNSTGSAWGTSYGVTGTGSVALSIAPQIQDATLYGTATLPLSSFGSTNTSIGLNDGTSSNFVKIGSGSVHEYATIHIGENSDGETYSTVTNIGGAVSFTDTNNTINFYNGYFNGALGSNGTASLTGSLQLTGTATANQNIATNQTSGSLTIGGTAQTSGVINIGGSNASTGAITLGRSTSTQTVNIANGVTVGGAQKTVNIGTLGSNSSTTNINIGNTTTGGGTLTFGQATGTQTTNIQTGATASGSTKTMSIGTGGLAGSTTNIAIGSVDGTSTTTLNGAVTTPKDATFNGVKVGKGAANISNNLAIGQAALTNASTTGIGNVGVSYIGTMSGLTTGSYNMALGGNALSLITTGTENTAMGVSAVERLTTGNYNTGVGAQAMRSPYAGSNNVGIGKSAGSSRTGPAEMLSPSNGVYIGALCLGVADSETNSIVIGAAAQGLGSNSTVIGTSATTQTKLFGTLEATGNANINGVMVGKGVSNISSNLAFGPSALSNSSTTGIEQTAIGSEALKSVTSGNYNLAFGSKALIALTSGSANCAFGNSSLGASTTASNNIAIGDAAGERLSTGSNNVFIGNSAGRYLNNGTDWVKFNTKSVYIGNSARSGLDGADNEIVIGGFQAQGLGTNTTSIGTSSTIKTKLFGALDTTGDITVKAGSTTGSAIITTPTTELVLSQTGDTFGTSSIRLQNRNNANGAIFETVGLGLVDFIFKTDATNQRNIRYETRGGLNQFEIGAPAGSYTLGVADTFVKIQKTTASTSTTTGALQVAGGIGVAGQINGLNFGKGAGALTGNHVVGELALASASLTGLANTAFGSSTLRDNTTGADNTGVGFFALRFNTTGTNNTAIGQGTLSANFTGNSNVALGRSALASNTNSSNTALGTYALASNVGGSDNIGIGRETANFIADGVTTLTTPTQSIYIGNFIRGNTVSETNAIAIGHNARSLGSNTTVIGTSSTTQTKVFGVIQSTTYTVATLPSASTVGVGARAFVTDASSPVFGAAVAGGGAVPVPVYSTGSAWFVG
jgi:hypothetical protein